MFKNNGARQTRRNVQDIIADRFGGPKRSVFFGARKDFPWAVILVFRVEGV